MSLPRRPARSLALAGRFGLLSLPSLCSAQQVSSYSPDDGGIVYSDYACAHIGPKRAGFDRELAANWVCHQEQMSPGVRASFVVDANQVRFDLDYDFAGFSCGSEIPVPLSWEFGLVVDGVRKPTGEGNPLYPLTQGSTQWIRLGPAPGPHQITLVWPSGADVDLLRLHLKESRDGSSPVLLDPPIRSEPVVTVFGDSITQGLSASHVLNTYPVRLGAEMNWQVINLGFAGRSTQPSDALLAAGVATCPAGRASAPDLLVLAIGSNDFHLLGDVHTRVDVFEQRYREWIEQFRTIQPVTPILCLTPLPRGDECKVTTRTMEEYRERIRAIIEARADRRIYLFEGRDLIALPPVAGDPLFEPELLHPNDLGFEQMTERLSDFNLVRNAGFELRPLANCLEIAESEPYLWTDSGTGASVVSDGPDGNRTLTISGAGMRTQLVYGLSEGDRLSLKATGSATVTGNPGTLTLEFLDASGGAIGRPLVLSFKQSSSRRIGRQGTAPAGTMRGRLVLSKSPGPGQFLVDDLELTVSEF